MFNTTNVETDKGRQEPQFIKRGPNELKITKLEAIKSRAGDKFKVQANFETKPMPEGFKGWEGALGQIGRCPLSIYTTGTDDYVSDFLSRLATIAEAMGLVEQLNAIKSDNIDDYLAKVTSLMQNKYVWFLAGSEEYMGKDKDGNPRPKEVMMLPKFGYVAATEAELKAKMKGGEWPTDQDEWFCKKLVAMDSDTVNKEVGNQPVKTEDLPF